MRFLVSGMVLAVSVCAAVSQEPTKLTLTRAIDLALKNNHALVIGADKIAEMRSAKRKAIADYFPRISNSSSFTHLTETDIVQFSQGSFGTFPGLGSLPTSNLVVAQGNQNHILSRSEIGQPISQFFKIRDGQRAARADEMGARADLEGLQSQIALGVRQLYYGLLVVQLEQKAVVEQLHVAEEQLGESEQDFNRGSALEVSLLEAKTSLLQSKQDELSLRIRRSDLTSQLNNVMGLRQGTDLELEEQEAAPLNLPGKEECIRLAQSVAPEIKSAEETVKKAEAGVAAAKAEYIPDVSAFARHDYQNGVGFLFHNYGAVGIGLTYTFFDGGKRRAAIAQREAQRAQARENLLRLKDDAAVNVQRALDKIEQSRSLVDVAKQAVTLREEADRLNGVQLQYAAIMSSKRREATAALAKSRADLAKAELGYMQAQAELEVLIGRLPR
jgi:outer membrane protein TolC